MSAAVPCFRPDGTLMDLMAVQPDEVDFAEMANCLSKIPRFNGRYRVPGYSVAQHCVMGADALYSECGDALLAGYFLLHDGHEYLSGDVTRPMVAAIEKLAGLPRDLQAAAHLAEARIAPRVQEAPVEMDLSIEKT